MIHPIKSKSFNLTFFLHFLFWCLSLILSFLFLYLSDDAWYKIVREEYRFAFFKMHLSLLPYYLGLIAAASLWLHAFEFALTRTIKISFNFKKLFILLVWFYFSVFASSLLHHYSNWALFFSHLNAVFSTSINYTFIQKIAPLLKLNLILFVLFSFVSFLFFFFYSRFRWLLIVPIVFLAIAYVRNIQPSEETKHSISTQQTQNLNYPSIIMVASDSLRADHLGAYGYERNTSPYIDEVSKKAALFKRFYVSTPSTTESLISLFTAKMPIQNGLRNIYPPKEIAAQIREDLNLPKVLKQAGYRCVVAGDWAASDFNRLMPNFDAMYIESDFTLRDYVEGALLRAHVPLLAFYSTPWTQWLVKGKFSLFESKLTQEEIFEKVKMEIEQASQSKQPLFLFLFLSTTHLPYVVPDSQEIIFGDPNYEGKHHKQVEFNLDELIHGNLNESLKKDAKRIKDIYDTTVFVFDQKVKQVDSWLKEFGLQEKSIFIISSDHGDDHFEPGTGLGRSIHAGEQSLKIPMIIRAPGILKAGVYSHLLREIDFSSSLLDLLGLKWSGGGESFAPLLKGEKIEDERVVYLEAPMNWAAPSLYPENEDHLSYPAITNLALPDFSWDTRLTVSGEQLKQLMKAKDRALIEGDTKVVYQPLKLGPLIYSCNILQDPHCQQHETASLKHKRMLYEFITQDPPSFYLAWPKEVFEKAFK